MLQKARDYRATAGSSTPMLVHCSAGVGRTGTLIAVDYNLEKAKAEKQVDVFACLNSMRRQRNTMVQTEGQYIFIYRTLADGVNRTETTPDDLERHVGLLLRPN